MTINADPIANGANGPASPGFTTVKPIVATKMKVPISSTRYLLTGISAFSQWEVEEGIAASNRVTR
jgi:hypothetical protein